jgi:hypothetical protein
MAVAISAGDPNRCVQPATSADALVDGNPLDQRREIAEHLDRGVTQPLILLEMPADKNELRTQLPRPPPRHAAGPVRRAQ